MTDRAWFDAAKGDIPNGRRPCPKDADGTTIDWDWVRSLDLAHGVGTIPESTPQSIHDALKADYATRERLESIIAQCNSAFMTDFDRFIGLLSSASRARLRQSSAQRQHQHAVASGRTATPMGGQSRTAGEGHHCRAQAVLRQRPSNDDQGMLDLSGEAGGTSAGNTAAENSDVKFPQQSPWTMSKDRTAAILDARAERRKAQRFQKRAGDAAMARSNLSGATSPGGAALPGGAPRLATLPDTIPSPTGATPTCPAATWMR